MADKEVAVVGCSFLPLKQIAPVELRLHTAAVVPMPVAVVLIVVIVVIVAVVFVCIYGSCWCYRW